MSDPLEEAGKLSPTTPICNRNATDDMSACSREGSVTTKKRPRDTDELTDAKVAPVTEPLGAQDFAKMSRSERKRHREKKRRSDVNRGFDGLMNLLLEIDPTVRTEVEERQLRGQWKGSSGTQDDNVLSRVELISRTVDVLRRVHNENEERKRIIASLTRQTRASATSGAFGMRAPATLFGRDPPISTTDEVAALLPPLTSSGQDDIALRAAAEVSQVYSQTLIDRLSALSPANQRELLSQQSQQNLLGFPNTLGGGLGTTDSLLSGRLQNTDIARQLANLSAMDSRQLLSGSLPGHASLPQPRGSLSDQYDYLQMLRERQQQGASRYPPHGEDSENSRFTQGSSDRSGRGPNYM